jgi:hypothetical protein
MADLLFSLQCLCFLKMQFSATQRNVLASEMEGCGTVDHPEDTKFIQKAGRSGLLSVSKLTRLFTSHGNTMVG